MAINRYYTPAQSQPFDPYVVDTATMYGNLRQAGYENLLAKQQVDASTQDEIGKTLDSLKTFAPENTEVLVGLNTGKTVTEKSKLPDYYNQITSQIYKGASDIAEKYNSNYASPEAQREVSEYLKSVKSYLPTLQELKNSDKALGEQNKITQKHIGDTPLTELEGTLGEHNLAVRNRWVNPNDSTFHTSLSSPTKGVDLIKGAKDYIADNLIKSYGNEAYHKLGVVVGPDGIPTFDISKISIETRKRLEKDLNVLADNYINSNKEHIHNVGLEGLQLKELTQGLKDQKDAEKTYNDTFEGKKIEFKNRFKEFKIDDIKTKSDINSKFLPNNYAKDAGLGIYSPTVNDFTPKDLPAMDNYNNNQPLAKINNEGEIYVNNPSKLIIDRIPMNTSQEVLGHLKSRYNLSEDKLKEIEPLVENTLNSKNTWSTGIFATDLEKAIGNLTHTKGTTKLPERISIGLKEGDKLDKNDPKAIKQVLTDNPELNKALKSHGFDLTVNPATGKAPQVDPIKFQKALKEYQEARENTNRVFTKEYKDNSLLNSGENENLNNNLTSSRIKFAKKETLPDDLPNLETINGGIDGKTFTDWLSTKHNVKYHTDGVIPSTGLFDANTAYHRVIEYSDSKGEPPKRLDFFQTTPFTNTQEGVDANVLNDISKQILSGKTDINGDYAGYKYNLKARYNPNKKSYEYEGDVYDNRGNKTSFKDYKKAVTFNTLVQERLNRLNTNRKPTSKEIQEIENEVESLLDNQD